MLDILPGLETSAVFQPDMEGLIHRLFQWAETSTEPLQSYATGLLAAAMEVQDIATGFREQNGKMVPFMLKRLHELQKEAAEERRQSNVTRPFAHLGQNRANNSVADSEHKAFPGKRKVREKSRENGVVKSPPELADYSSSDDEEKDEGSSPPNKKIKNEVEDVQSTPVKKDTPDREGSEMMSPPIAIPPLNSGKNNPSNSQVYIVDIFIIN